MKHSLVLLTRPSPSHFTTRTRTNCRWNRDNRILFLEPLKSKIGLFVHVLLYKYFVRMVTPSHIRPKLARMSDA
jgi:hypothetical protein